MAWTLTGTTRARAFFTAAFLASALLSLGAASAGVIPDFGFDFVTIGDTGNPAWPGGKYGQTAGRGSVDYQYRMAKLEVSSAQWLEFINIFAPQSDNPGTFLRPNTSGLRQVTGQPGAYFLNPYVDNAGELPVLGINWREAAMYVNWLNNDKATDWSAIQSGAYDVSTFTQNADGTFNDQLTHDPGARFWIPTLDEWLKAAHWDPNKNGEGEGGWWEYPGMSDEPLTPGEPGEGQTSAGLSASDGANIIPLGSYPDTPSPWGLLDTSGGAAEWTEEAIGELGLIARALGGAWAGSDQFALDFFDSIDTINGLRPTFPFDGGLRIASAIPSPTGPALADLNHDGVVNGADLGTLLVNWGPCDQVRSACPADFNNDTIVDAADLMDILANWGLVGSR